MTTAAAKNVLFEILDLWSRGQGITSVLTDLDAVGRRGDSVEIPFMTAVTVNTSEAVGPAASSISADVLTVDTPRFINQGMTNAQQRLLLDGGPGGAGNGFTRQLSRRTAGDMVNAIDMFYIKELLKTAALSTANHVNLDLGVTTATDDLIATPIAAHARTGRHHAEQPDDMDCVAPRPSWCSSRCELSRTQFAGHHRQWRLRYPPYRHPGRLSVHGA